MGQNATLVKRLNSVEEFEREPVPESKLKGLKSFIGMYAGEHTAALLMWLWDYLLETYWLY
jgi:hypothetical protein